MIKLFILILLLLFNSLYAQDLGFDANNQCAFDSINGLIDDGTEGAINGSIKVKRQQNNFTLIEIPIVFHFVLDSVDQTAVNQSDVINQLNFLNQRFQQLNNQSSVRNIFRNIIGNPNIIFCLAQIDPNGNPTNGITYFRTPRNSFNTSAGEWNLMKTAPLGTPTWNPTEYINVWIVDILGGYAGYAYRPTAGVVGSFIDGIVLDYLTGFKFTQTVLTHEMGHYFGLLHTWGSSNGCTSDDGIDDTPFSFQNNYGCNFSINSCPDITSLWGGVDPPDQVENFMDYASCASMFTIQQAMSMRNVLSTLRSGLMTSNKCLNVSLPIKDIRSQIDSEGLKVSLKWKVGYEYNNMGYSVERSNDLVNYIKVVPFINSNTSYYYSISDLTPSEGTYYYRINSISNDGIVLTEDIKSITVTNYVHNTIIKYYFLNIDKNKNTQIKYE